MSIVLNTNVTSLTIQRHLRTTEAGLEGSLGKLVSGLRINSAKDDVASMAIDTRFNAQSVGMREALRNSDHAISITQTADGALQEVTNNLQRMREAAVQAANGTYTSADRSSLQKELATLQLEISRVIVSVEVNGTKVLGSSAVLSFQLDHSGGPGRNKESAVDLEINALQRASDNGIGSALGKQLAIGTASAARSAIAMLDRMLDRISDARAKFGAAQGRLETAERYLGKAAEDLEAARSRITDSDYGREVATLTRHRILYESGLAMLAQANANPEVALSLLR